MNYLLAVAALILFVPIIMLGGGSSNKNEKNNRNGSKKRRNGLWSDPDNSSHFDEDRDMHNVDEDGYCYECDEYEEDI